MSILIIVAIISVVIGYILGVVLPPYRLRESGSDLLIDDVEAFNLIKTFHEHYGENIQLSSGYFDIEELESTIQHFKNLINNRGCTMCGLEIFLGRDKSNTLVLVPTVLQGNQHIPVLHHNDQLVKIYDNGVINNIESGEIIKFCARKKDSRGGIIDKAVSQGGNNGAASDSGGNQMRPPYPPPSGGQ